MTMIVLRLINLKTTKDLHIYLRIIKTKIDGEIKILTNQLKTNDFTTPDQRLSVGKIILQTIHDRRT